MNTVYLILISLFMQHSAITPEINGAANLKMFSVAPLTTHYVIRDRNKFSKSNNSIRVLDLGVYGWSAFRINESYKVFDSLNDKDQISIWNAYVKLRELVDNDVNNITPFNSTSYYSSYMNYTSAGFLEKDLVQVEPSDLIRSIRGFELIFVIEAFRLTRCYQTLHSTDSSDLIPENVFHNWRKHTSCRVN